MVKDSTKPTAEVSLTDGEGKAEDLATGLYLVLADKAQTTNYEYTFTPYLISLPNNYYYQTGDDEWVYELSEVVLKPEQTPRYGSLVIDKTVRDFNATSGAQATFVFQGRNIFCIYHRENRWNHRRCYGSRKRACGSIITACCYCSYKVYRNDTIIIISILVFKNEIMIRESRKNY